ncbi:MAG: signal peptide peptidase SppA [Bacillota bacterium]|nr:signal peptide peptidase SppA [Bacillota bacterium]
MNENENLTGRNEEQQTGAQGAPVRAKDAWRDRNRSNGWKGNADDSGQQGPYYYGSQPSRKGKAKKPFVVFGSILGGLLVLAVLFGSIGSNTNGFREDAASIGEDHLGVLYVEGTIGEESTTYSQQYLLDSLDGMMENDHNEGLLLYVNTPGGTVSEIDELYLKIKEYQETTDRPVYVYMGDQATSGGYYISAPADKILANRNCWTGSIGVIVGTLFDISGFLDQHGIKADNITSGENKDMGSMTEPMTEEQRQILQSLVDESYDQFVGVIVEGRELDEEYVRSVSDGRIYTAKQAKQLGLIDEVVSTYDDALADMMDECDLWDCEVYEFWYWEDLSLLDVLLQSANQLSESLDSKSDISALVDLMERKQELPLRYKCEVVR